jgi:HAD superfamily hydrolase (TIGR01509 family)
MTLKALIFDVDGTIAETEEAHRLAFNRAFEELQLGWQWDPTLYRELLKVTGGRERLHYYLNGWEPDPLARQAAESRIGEIHTRKTALYGDMIRSGGPALRPGVARLVDEARRSGVALAIATTTSLVNLEVLFDAIWSKDALGWFSVVVGGDMVQHKKPAADAYRLVLDGLGFAPEDCVAIEDSRNGLVSADEAGIPTVITVSRYTTHETFGNALAVVSDLGEPHAPFAPLGGLAAEPDVLTLDLLRRWLPC